MSPRAAHLWLLEHVYSFLETVAASDPLVALERQASGWAFMRFSARLERGVEDAFAMMHREQEWSLVERPMLATGEPILMEGLSASLLDASRKRQKKIATSLRASFVGVFEVTARKKDSVTLRDLATQRSHRLHEHSEVLEYPEGAIALGRLIPFGKELHLRSPGMLFFKPDAPDHGAELAAAWKETTAEGMPASLALEAVISTGVLGAKVPNDVPPAESADAAAHLAYELAIELDQAQLAERPPLDDVPPSLRKPVNAPHRRALRLPLDWTLAEWMAALNAMSGVREG